jgi:adenosine tuberculosinyltransferase
VQAETFLHLPTAELAQIVRESGPNVCAFPINGTRRWFMVEHAAEVESDLERAYLETIEQKHVAIYRLFFDHGIDTLLAPVFGPDLVERGEEYIKMAAGGLAWLATHKAFLDFYDEYDVRVRFYGDYRNFFAGTSTAYLADVFEDVTERTRDHRKHCLFFGVCAHDAVETTGQMAIDYHTRCGRAPDKRALIEMYYGEYVPPLSLFIGFDKFCAFDTPLLTSGNEDLYFTVSPSLYLGEQQLREILYDHLYTRRMEETDYSEMSPDDWGAMRNFYRANAGKTLGVGARQERGGYWYPLPQVELPTDFNQPQEQR